MFSLNLSRLCKTFLPLATIPLYLNYHDCFWFKNGPKRNKIEKRIFTEVLISNKPCEDRNASLQLTAIEGYAAAVYDGHGGWQVSEYCSKNLLQELNKSIERNKNIILDQDELIRTGIRQAFRICEQNFLNAARLGYDFGFGRFARAGSCALVCVVANNKVYAGNAGDSVGIIVQQQKNGQLNYQEINRELNANNSQQRERLKRLFPLQEDVVVCKKQNYKSCYVKGRLQPTRSIGDLRLKHPEFNNPKNYSKSHDFQPPLKVFTGPYVNWQPQIKTFDLKPTDKLIVLASDGLWDELGRQEVAQLSKNKNTQAFPKHLVRSALQHAADSAKMPIQTLIDIPQGSKRNLHDDITVIVIDLQNQFK